MGVAIKSAVSYAGSLSVDALDEVLLTVLMPHDYLSSVIYSKTPTLYHTSMENTSGQVLDVRASHLAHEWVVTWEYH